MATATLDRVELTYGDHDEHQLDARDRCDRCGSQAYIRATLRTPKEGEEGLLMFCAHHADAYERAIMPILREWHDERARLKENRKQGSEN